MMEIYRKNKTPLSKFVIFFHLELTFCNYKQPEAFENFGFFLVNCNFMIIMAAVK